MKPEEISGHWAWVNGLLERMEKDADKEKMPLIIGRETAKYLYETAMIHGAKHAEQEANCNQFSLTIETLPPWTCTCKPIVKDGKMYCTCGDGK